MNKEIEDLRQLEIEKKIQQRKEAKEELAKFKAQQDRYKKQREIEEKEIDEIIAINKKAKAKIERKMEEKMEAMRKELQLRRDAAAKSVIAQAAERSAEEERILKKAIDEKEAA